MLEVVNAADCLLRLRLRYNLLKGRVLVPVGGIVEVVCDVELVAVRRFQLPDFWIVMILLVI